MLRDESLEERIRRVTQEHVDLAPYDPRWPELFRAEAEHLRACLPADLVGRIEHFGSTAVPGLVAKPIVDMLVEVSDLQATRTRIAPVLEAQGYDYFWRPAMFDGPPYYAWFIKRAPTGERTHHIHMVEEHFEHWDRLLFRDYLVAHPSVAAEYGGLKTRLAGAHPDDRVAYTRGKSEFVERVTREARRYYMRDPRALPYDAAAADFQAARTGFRERPYLDRLLQGLAPGARLLDLGCGSGRPIGAHLTARGFRVIGVDLSQQLLAFARRDVPQMRLVQADMLYLSWQQPFAAVVAWDAVFHVRRADQPRLFRRLAQWLPSGGRLLLTLGGSAWEGISEMLGHTFFYSGMDPAESLACLEEAGFGIEFHEIDDPSGRGHMVVLASKTMGWTPLADSLKQFSEDFMDGRAQPPAKPRHSL